MTLIVSIRTVDGIVIAGDSLATYSPPVPQVQGDAEIICPNCSHRHLEQVTIPGQTTPSITLSYAQKVFPFLGRYGIGAYGGGSISGKTIYFALREYERQLRDGEKTFPASAKEAAERIGEYLQTLLHKDIAQWQLNLDEFDDGWSYMGAQVVGYDSGVPLTYNVEVGKGVNIQPCGGLDVTLTGQWQLFAAIREKLYDIDPQSLPLFEYFSLQDAIEYAEFLIQTTATFQRFSRRIPNVGGSIDIALVTPFDHFQWIRQKELYSQLSETSRI